MSRQFGFLFSLSLNFLGLIVAERLFDGIFMTGYGWALLAALILTVLQMVVKPALILLTLPLTIVSMGFFLLIINGLIFWLAGNMLEGYQVHGFVSAIGGAVVVSVLSLLAGFFSNSAKMQRKEAAARQQGQRVHIFTFRNSSNPQPGQRPDSSEKVSSLRPRQPGGDDNVVDLEVDEHGQWKIKD